MEIAANTPTRNRTIGGVTVQVPQPYEAGHTVTEGEASALNQTIAENLSNNLRSKVEDGMGEAEVQKLVDDYIAEYEMGVRQVGAGSSRTVDPVEREALKLALNKAKELVAGKGLKQKDVDMNALRDKIFEANEEALMTAAAKLVKQQEAAKKNAGELSLDDISIDEKPTEEEAA